ncbi:MAG: peptide chain release factor N(5)-glutamine methyltransferase [Planctomycetota bacterium]
MPATETWTVRRLIEWTTSFLDRKGIDSPRLSAEMLLGHVLSLRRIQLYTDHDRPLATDELTEFRDLVKRAGEHEPIQYLVGKAYFFNLELDVEPGVLIPRPDTETLVEEAIAHLKPVESPTVLDLCTGTGSVALAIAMQISTARVVAVDIADEAVALARRNVEKHGLGDRVEVVAGDLFAPVAGCTFDAVVANPPYIATDQLVGLDRNVRDHEPMLALDGGPDGLDPHRRILAEADSFLEPGGLLALEIAFDQGENALALAQGFPSFTDRQIVRDLARRPRVLTMHLAS